MSTGAKRALSPGISLLVIGDSLSALDLLSNAVAQPGLEVLQASGPQAGFDLFLERRPQIVIADVMMPPVNGLEILQRIMKIDPATDVILISAHYSIEAAVEAIKQGASDYLKKPVSPESLRERVRRLVEEADWRQRAAHIEKGFTTDAQFEGIVGRCPLIQEVFARIRRIAPHYRSALITGETGTGKDLIARAIHNSSPAACGRFVVLNCSAVVETLFESELFGHVKGAFTGATRDKPGLFEHAHGGTLFLDEIGDMPLGTQAKLLRVLQDQEVQRVGALNTRKVDVRVIAATNHNLREAVAQKQFREDLYYRLSMVEIHAPRLADRKEDLPLLQQHFVDRFAQQYGKEILGITHRAQIRLAQHSWPGNVRELENVIGHAAMMTETSVLDVQDLPLWLQNPEEQPGRDSHATSAASSPPSKTLAEIERAHIIHSLRESGGIITAAANRLGVPRTTLNAIMRRLNITRDDI